MHRTQNVIKERNDFFSAKYQKCCSDGLKIFVIKLKTVEEKLRSLSMKRPVN